MKKLLLLVLLATLTSSALYSMESNFPNATKIHYITTKISINAIEKKAKTGDIASDLAICDFYKSIKDPLYKITHEASKIVLKRYSLLDDEGEVPSVTKNAFKQFENIK